MYLSEVSQSGLPHPNLNIVHKRSLCRAKVSQEDLPVLAHANLSVSARAGLVLGDDKRGLGAAHKVGARATKLELLEERAFLPHLEYGRGAPRWLWSCCRCWL